MTRPEAPSVTCVSSVETFLLSVNPSLTCYAKAFVDFGYEDVSLLVSADMEDLSHDFISMSVKKNHARLIVKAVSALKCNTEWPLPHSHTPTAAPTSAPTPAPTSVPTPAPTPAPSLDTTSGVKIIELLSPANESASPPTRLQHRNKEMASHVLLKAASEQKMQAAHLRKMSELEKLKKFSLIDSQKTEKAVQKRKKSQAIKPAILKTKSEQKHSKAELRKVEAKSKKTAFSRSDSLKIVEKQARKLIQDVIKPAVSKSAIDSKIKTAEERKSQAQSQKVAFARADSLKAEQARKKVSFQTNKEKLNKENSQKLSNAAERKAQQLEKKTAFARSDSQKVKAKGGGWVHVDDEEEEEAVSMRTPSAPVSPPAMLGASMTWGDAAEHHKKRE